MSSNIQSKTFSAIGAGAVLRLAAGKVLAYSATVAGGEEFVGSAYLQRSTDGLQTWQNLVTVLDVTDSTGVTGTVIAPNGGAYYRWFVQTFTGANNLVTSIYEQVQATKTRFLAAGAVAGATAGWAVSAADKGFAATLPKNKTSSTLVLPITGLEVGDVITGFYLVGSVQGTSGKATALAADLRSLTRKSDGTTATDASVGALAAVSAEANAPLSATAYGVTGLSHTVIEGESFYVLVTGTTFNDNGNTAEIQAVAVKLA